MTSPVAPRPRSRKRRWAEAVEQQPVDVRGADELEEFGNDGEPRSDGRPGLQPAGEGIAARPRKDNDGFGCLGASRRQDGARQRFGGAVAGVGEGVARVGGFEEIDRLGPEVAAAIAEYNAEFGASERAAAGDVLGAVEFGIVDGAQQNVEPLLFVGLTRPLGGEVEVVEDLPGGIQAGPGRFADDLGDDVAAGLSLAFYTMARPSRPSFQRAVTN